MSNAVTVNKYFSAADCVLPPITTKVVAQNCTVKLGNTRYCSPRLHGYIGQEVMLFSLENGDLGICQGSEFICNATAQRTGA